MKKTLSAVLAALMLTAVLSGCDNTTNGNSGDNSTSNSSSTSTSTSSSEDSQPTDSSTPSDSDSSGENSGDDTPGSTASAQKYVETALSTDEWGAMDFNTAETLELLDEEDREGRLQGFMQGFNPEWAEDWCFANELISVNLLRVYVAKPKAGSESELKAWYEDYFDYCKKSAAFYPQQEVSAAGSVMGETPDGYYYLIVHENGADIESYMLANA